LPLHLRHLYFRPNQKCSHGAEVAMTILRVVKVFISLAGAWLDVTSLPRNVAGQQPSLFCPLTVTVLSTAPNTEVCSVDILWLTPGGPFLLLLLYINGIVHKL